MRREVREIAAQTSSARHALKPSVDRFCKAIVRAEHVPVPPAASPNASLMATREVGQVLRAFVDSHKNGRQRPLSEAVKTAVNQIERGLSVPVPPTPRLSVSVIGGNHSVSLECGGGATNVWDRLATFLDRGLKLARFRVCEYPKCEEPPALFYDASMRGDRRTCTASHQAALKMRRHRQQAKSMTPAQKRAHKRFRGVVRRASLDV